MKLLLLFLFLTCFLAIRSGRRGKPPRMWPLLVASVVVGAAFFRLRVI
jgi:hypothetical protein